MTPILKVPEVLLQIKDDPDFLDKLFIDLSKIHEGRQSYFIIGEESSELTEDQVEFLQERVSITRGPFGSGVAEEVS